MLDRVKSITSRISLFLFGTNFTVRVDRDNKSGENGRIFIQITYDAPCSISNENMSWGGRKWYLSEYMTDDEVVKTCYGAFKMCVEHEVMEAFKVDGKILFNPHVNFEEFLKITDKEVRRE